MTTARQEKRYCRGCKCTVDAGVFISDGQLYKQCDRCRARVHDRQRSDATIVCECGREVLRTSLRDHLRTLYHEKRMSEKRLGQTAREAQDVARTPMRSTSASGCQSAAAAAASGHSAVEGSGHSAATQASISISIDQST